MVAQIEPECRWPVTREQFERMIEAGVFRVEDRVELVEGVLVKVSPQGDAHARVIASLAHALATALGQRAQIAQQLPFPASAWSRPEPDVAVWPLAGVRDPLPERPLFVAEVAVTSLRDDRLAKGPLYAHAGIVEYWIVNLVDHVVEVYRKPQPDGYAEHRDGRRGDRIPLVSFPDVQIAVDDFLP